MSISMAHDRSRTSLCNLVFYQNLDKEDRTIVPGMMQKITPASIADMLVRQEQF